MNGQWQRTFSGSALLGCITFLALFWCLKLAWPLDVPPLRGHVNDLAGLLDNAAAQQLEKRLADFEDREGTQVAVLTIPTLAGENLEQYSIRVAEAWRIGVKGRDNGVILLIARAERKVRIEVGLGLEDKLTDLESGRIIRNVMAPRFKEGDYYGGISLGVSAIMEAIKGEHGAGSRDLRQDHKGFSPAYTLLLALLVGCVFLGSISRILGGMTGAFGLPAVAHLLFPGLSLVFVALLALGGFVLGLFISFLFGRGGGGGFFGGPFLGGGGFGGGIGGGGFSGGGGDFGGGGASGDW